MDRDWNDHAISDSHSIMMTIANQSRRSAIVLIGNHILAGFFLTIGAYMLRTVNNADSKVAREFPVKMNYPFPSSMVLESPLFECILIWQICLVLSLASVVGMINGLLATLVSRYTINYSYTNLKISLRYFEIKKTM